MLLFIGLYEVVLKKKKLRLCISLEKNHNIIYAYFVRWHVNLCAIIKSAINFLYFCRFSSFTFQNESWLSLMVTARQCATDKVLCATVRGDKTTRRLFISLVEKPPPCFNFTFLSIFALSDPQAFVIRLPQIR